jgi:hypothetical protein
MTTYFIKGLADYSEEALITEVKRVASVITNQKITIKEFNNIARLAH